MGQRGRMRRRREDEVEELPAEAEPAAAPTTPPQPRPANRALDLQRSAGNRAVGAALDRWALPWVPQTRTPQWPKERQAIFDGEAIPLLSFAWGEPHSGTGAGAPGRTTVQEIGLTIAMGEHSAEFLRAAADGRPFAKVVLVLPGENGTGVTITLTDVVVAGYSSSGTTDSVRLNFKVHTFGTSPPAP